MPSAQEAIYKQEAAGYESLVAHEDYEHNIIKALTEIKPFEGLRVVETGAGTGRLTEMLAPLVERICAFDLQAHMLGVLAQKARRGGGRHCQVGVADHRHLPVPSHQADLLIGGWTVCYLYVNYPDTWRRELSAGLAELQRVIRPGGTIVILETLGTGHETPYVHEHLTPYFDFLKNAGFASTWIRTDYLFDSPEQAADSMRFFFGDDMATKVMENEWRIVPECTGVWWLNI